ncbi:MAG: GSCFA domain-containing protein [Chloroflexota bacterium]
MPRDRLFDFTTPDVHVQAGRDDLERWLSRETRNRLPTKPELLEQGLSSVLKGWTPSEPIIRPDTRVFAMGSCFAANFIGWLGDQGFNTGLTDPYAALVKSGFAFENVAVIAQQFRWAFGLLDGSDLLWVNPDRELVDATEERRQLLRSVLEHSDVLIITLGLSEVWYDRMTGEPLWRAVPSRHLDRNRHRFKVLTVAETVHHLETIDRLRAEHVPDLKIVFTVSPVRFLSTFRPISAMTANSVSKAVLRAGLDEFLRARWDRLNSTYYYFPSYEIVTEVFRDAYEADARHIHPAAVSQVLDVFAAKYTSLGSTLTTDGPDESQLPDGYLLSRIAELEAHLADARTVGDERLAVIQGLETALGERLDVIQVLDRAANERLELIQHLDAQCRLQADLIRQLEGAATGEPGGES